MTKILTAEDEGKLRQLDHHVHEAKEHLAYLQTERRKILNRAYQRKHKAKQKSA